MYKSKPQDFSCLHPERCMLMVEWLNKDMTALSCVQPSFLEELPRQVNVYETASMYLNSSLLWKTLQPWGGRQTWLWQAVCSGGRLRFICSKFILKQHWKLDVRAVCFLHEPGGETSCRTRCAAHSLSLSLSINICSVFQRSVKVFFTVRQTELLSADGAVFWQGLIYRASNES